MDRGPSAKESFSFDVVVIGAGPTGLACGIDAKRAGLSVANIDKGCLVNSLYNYPSNMTFFTTPELLEIGDLPFSSPNQKPTRQEALEYYRKAAEHYQLDVRQYEPVLKVEGSDNHFVVHTTNLHGRKREYRAHKLILATGYYDRPNYMNIPGEDLSKVMHYYREPHPFFGLNVLIIGGKNSAAIAALELWRHGARVTLVHRGPGISNSVKYWIKPDIENRIKAGQVNAYFNTRVREITLEHVVLDTPQGEVTLENDYVFALTGYHPDFEFLCSLGIELSGEADKRPVVNPQTLESNVPGIYLAGVIVAGMRTSEIFIENGRFHGALIAADLKQKLAGRDGECVVGRFRSGARSEPALSLSKGPPLDIEVPQWLKPCPSMPCSPFRQAYIVEPYRIGILAVVAVHLESDIHITAVVIGLRVVVLVHGADVTVQGDADVVHLSVDALDLPGQMVPGVRRDRRARYRGRFPSFGLGIPDVPMAGVPVAALAAPGVTRASHALIDVEL